MKSILKTASEYIEAYKSGLVSFRELLEMIEYLQTHALFTWCSSWEAIDQALIFFDEAEQWKGSENPAEEIQRLFKENLPSRIEDTPINYQRSGQVNCVKADLYFFEWIQETAENIVNSQASPSTKEWYQDQVNKWMNDFKYMLPAAIDEELEKITADKYNLQW